MTKAKQIINGKLKCSTCKYLLPLEEFGKHKRTATGYRLNCKACENLNQRKSRPKAPTNTGINGIYEIECDHCKNTFTTKFVNQVFCSPKCTKRNWYEKNEMKK